MKLQSILPEFFQKTTGFDVQFAAFLALLTFTSKKILLLANPQSFSNFFLLAIFLRSQVYAPLLYFLSCKENKEFR